MVGSEKARDASALPSDASGIPPTHGHILKQDAEIPIARPKGQRSEREFTLPYRTGECGCAELSEIVGAMLIDVTTAYPPAACKVACQGASEYGCPEYFDTGDAMLTHMATAHPLGDEDESLFISGGSGGTQEERENKIQ